MWIARPGLRITHHDDEEGVAEGVRADDEGFCNTPSDLYAAPRFDVFAIGDSFTWCTSVRADQAWPARLAEQSGLRTYNAGLPGRGLYEYLQILKLFGVAKRPRAVVMAVYEGNDFRDAHRFHRARSQSAAEVDAGLCVFSWRQACAVHAALDASGPGRRSYAWNFLSGTIRWAAKSLGKREIDFRYDVEFPDGVVLRFNSENGDRDEVQYARWLQAGELGTQLFDEALEGFTKLAGTHRFEPIVVYLPSAYTAYAQMSRFVDAPGVEAPLRAYSRTLRAYFARRGEELGYRFLDATPALQRASRARPASRRLYFHSNVHLTAEGHDVVARLLAAELAAPRAAAVSAGPKPAAGAPPRAAPN